MNYSGEKVRRYTRVPSLRLDTARTEEYLPAGLVMRPGCATLPRRSASTPEPARDQLPPQSTDADIPESTLGCPVADATRRLERQSEIVLLNTWETGP
jgi:hypothetical protein